MRLRVLSDLHLCYAALEVPAVDAEVVVLVGDINRGARGVEWAHQVFPGQLVLYVLGNHEFYRGCVEEVYAACERAAACGKADVRILQDSECVVGDVAFLGATLWTDFGLFGAQRKDAAIAKVRKLAPDFRIIRTMALNGCQRVLEPADVEHAFARSRDWLQARIRHHRDVGNKVCAITHFAPSRGSLAPRFATDPGSAYFVNTFDDWMSGDGPDLWLHGHTHD
ncbi:MAG TPA: metallophosphoesterase, partial [Rhodanobacteraceae bacterium]|nr:metallophosphoesterase [Rhodanobacteraceae bacterium]